VFSNDDWTLVGFLSDEQSVAAEQLQQVATWRLHDTPGGAVVHAPGAVVGDASAELLSAPGLTDRRVEFTGDNCAGTPVRTESRLGPVAMGYWCEHGVYVRITGPIAYVAHALAVLRVRVEARANG
jgi:hypothetical protein